MVIDWKALIGFSTLAAMLALLSPGVTVVRAETVASKGAAVVCEEGAARSVEPNTAASQAAVRGARDSDLAAASAANGVIVLNTQGYNYQPSNFPRRQPPVPDKPE